MSGVLIGATRVTYSKSTVERAKKSWNPDNRSSSDRIEGGLNDPAFMAASTQASR